MNLSISLVVPRVTSSFYFQYYDWCADIDNNTFVWQRMSLCLRWQTDINFIPVVLTFNSEQRPPSVTSDLLFDWQVNSSFSFLALYNFTDLCPACYFLINGQSVPILHIYKWQLLYIHIKRISSFLFVTAY